jgi:hypothetical protein
VFPLRNGNEISLSFRYVFSGVQRLTTSVSMSQEAYLGIRFPFPAGLEDIPNGIIELRNFLAFAVGRPMRVLRAYGVHHASEDQLGRPGRVEVPHQVSVETVFHLINPPAPARGLLDYEMLFSRASASDRLVHVLNAWWEMLHYSARSSTSTSGRCLRNRCSTSRGS